MLSYIGQEFIFRGTFDQREIPKAAGFRWDADRKAWVTKHAHVAERVPMTLRTRDAQRALEWHGHQHELSNSAEGEGLLNTPAPSGLDYLPYQCSGIRHAARALSRYPGALIADEPGLGKTIQAIGLVNQRPEWSRILVVCPNTPKINWAQEWGRWAVAEWQISLYFSRGKERINPSPLRVYPERSVFIINYDLLEKHLAEFSYDVFNLIIFDEAHYLKNPKAKRTKAALAIPTARRLFLTGTPILNRPVELWPIVHACAPAVFPEFWGFARRYCGMKPKILGSRCVWDFFGASNLDQLQKTLRYNFMVRRRKADVLISLPPKRRQVIALEAPAEQIEQEKRAWASAVSKLGYEEAVKKLRSTPAALEDMAAIRSGLAKAKVRPAVAHIEDILLSEEKVIVFAHHRVMLSRLAEKLEKYGLVQINGDTPAEHRAKFVNLFQTNPGVRIFLGQIQAAGEAITLTAAQTVIFVEQDWTPGRNEQAEDRAHRIGQTGSVLVQYIVFDGSLDAYLAKTCLRKESVIDQAINQ